MGPALPTAPLPQAALQPSAVQKGGWLKMAQIRVFGGPPEKSHHGVRVARIRMVCTIMGGVGVVPVPCEKSIFFPSHNVGGKNFQNKLRNQ